MFFIRTGKETRTSSNDCITPAFCTFSRSAELLPNVWALRALAVLSEDAGAAEAYYDRAFALGFPDVGFAQEYLKLLVTGKKHAKAYEVFKALPDQ